MIVRPAKIQELEKIFRIFDLARQHMRDEGNDKQWINGYPQIDLIIHDIEDNQFFTWVDEETDEIHGVFSFILGNDPTYDVIEGGKWLNHKPYGTIHRMGSDGQVKGMLESCLEFCKSKVDNIRIDTHEMNTSMQAAVKKQGFQYCGVIYVADGSPRVAYQLEVK